MDECPRGWGVATCGCNIIYRSKSPDVVSQLLEYVATPVSVLECGVRLWLVICPPSRFLGLNGRQVRDNWTRALYCTEV